MYENNRKLTANATFTRYISGRYQNFYYMTDYHCKWFLISINITSGFNYLIFFKVLLPELKGLRKWQETCKLELQRMLIVYGSKTNF